MNSKIARAFRSLAMTAALAVAATVGIASPAGAQEGPGYCYTLDSCFTGHCYWWYLGEGASGQNLPGECNGVVLPVPLERVWCDVQYVLEGCNFTETSDPCSYVRCGNPHCDVYEWFCSEEASWCVSNPVDCVSKVDPSTEEATRTLAQLG